MLYWCLFIVYYKIKFKLTINKIGVGEKQMLM